MEDGCVEKRHIEIDNQADANFDIESPDIKCIGDLRTAVRLRENTPAVKLPDYDFDCVQSSASLKCILPDHDKPTFAVIRPDIDEFDCVILAWHERRHSDSCALFVVPKRHRQKSFHKQLRGMTLITTIQKNEVSLNSTLKNELSNQGLKTSSTLKAGTTGVPWDLEV